MALLCVSGAHETIRFHAALNMALPRLVSLTEKLENAASATGEPLSTLRCRYEELQRSWEQAKRACRRLHEDILRLVAPEGRGETKC